MTRKLYLIPNIISEDDHPVFKYQKVKDVRVFFVEHQKAAISLLRKADPGFPVQSCQFYLLNEHTLKDQLEGYLKIMVDHDAGVISESGCPCVADPGAELVLQAHAHGIEVIPLVGASSIILAMMSSGLNGQDFAFNGYLPKDKQQRIAKIKLLEKRALLEKQTQIFMETPYRNNSVLEDLLLTLKGSTLLCVAFDVTGQSQSVQTKPVAQWQQTTRQLAKKPALFLIGDPAGWHRP